MTDISNPRVTVEQTTLEKLQEVYSARINTQDPSILVNAALLHLLMGEKLMEELNHLISSLKFLKMQNPQDLDNP